jgi:hypothetical protein
MKNICEGMEDRLEELLLDRASARPAVHAHVEGCAGCRRRLDELRATMALLDQWEAPEPSPYFLTRLEARLREERATEPQGWIERLRSYFVYETMSHVRPLAAMAMTFLLLLGGSAYLGVTNWDRPPEQAAVVHDLQTLDNNAQLLDQLEALSSNNTNGE